MPKNNIFSSSITLSKEEAMRLVPAPSKVNAYEYHDDDITRAIAAKLDQENYSYEVGCTFLLEKPINGTIVAILPVSDVTSTASIGLDTFFNKHKISPNRVPECLSYLLNHLEELKTLDNNEALERIQAILKNKDSQGSDDSSNISESLLIKLQGCDFNALTVGKEIDDNKPKDVFDELASKLFEKNEAKIRILFPFNSNNRKEGEKAHDGHWLTGEVLIHKTDNRYDVTMTAHNPLGGGELPHTELQESIQKRIEEFNPTAEIYLTPKQSDYKTKRQQDSVSCGVIVAHELIERLHDKPLETVYPPYCTQLRQKQYNMIKGYLKSSKGKVELAERLMSVIVVKNENSLAEAMTNLCMDRKRFGDIPHAPSKTRYLYYRFLFAQLQHHVHCTQEGLDHDQVLDKLDADYHLVLESIKDNPHPNYSELSSGLKDLDLRSPYDRKHKRKNSLVYVRPKRMGVEPGFEGFLIEDLLFLLAKKFPDRKSRLECFDKHEQDLGKLYRTYENELPLYLVKQVYDDNELSFFGNIGPSEEDLKRSKTVQEAYDLNPIWGKIFVTAYAAGRKTRPTIKNQEAFGEAFANNITSLTMNTQRQTVLLSKYENGDPMIILSSEIIPNTRTLAPLAGSKDGCHNYRVRPTSWNPDEIQYLTNRSIEDLTTFYMTLILQGDRDGVGRSGQNELETSNNKLVGIDKGHAFRNKNKLIQQMRSNFHLPKEILNEYKNFSIFYDARRQEFIKGLLYFAKLAGRHIPPNLIKKYGDEFAEKLDTIIPQSHVTVGEDFFNELNEFARRNWKHKEYLSHAQHIRKIANNLADSIEELLTKFQKTLFEEPKIIDLLENLEKCQFPKKMTLRSPDKTVLLKHPRPIDEKYIVAWSVKRRDKNEICFSATFSDKTQRDKARKNLLTFTNRRNLFKEEKDEKTLYFWCDESDVSNLLKEFNEEELEKHYFNKDHCYKLTLVKEQAILDLLNNPSQYKAMFTISLHLKNRTANEDPGYFFLIEGGPEAEKITESQRTKIKNFLEHNALFNSLPRKPSETLAIQIDDRSLDKIYEQLKQLIDYFEKNQADFIPEPVNSRDDEPLECLEIDGVIPTWISPSKFQEQVLMIMNNSQEKFKELKKLVKKNKDYINLLIDEDENTMLHLAVRKEENNIVNYLLEEGADPLLLNKQGKGCLEIAMENQDKEAFHALSTCLSALQEAQLFTNAKLLPINERKKAVELFEAANHVLEHYSSMLAERVNPTWRQFFTFILTNFQMSYGRDFRKERANQLIRFYRALVKAYTEGKIHKLHYVMKQAKDSGFFDNGALHDNLNKAVREFYRNNDPATLKKNYKNRREATSLNFCQKLVFSEQRIVQTKIHEKVEKLTEENQLVQKQTKEFMDLIIERNKELEKQVAEQKTNNENLQLEVAKQNEKSEKLEQQLTEQGKENQEIQKQLVKQTEELAKEREDKKSLLNEITLLKERMEMFEMFMKNYPSNNNQVINPPPASPINNRYGFHANSQPTASPSLTALKDPGDRTEESGQEMK